MMEQYTEATAASKEYAAIKTANAANGIETLEGLGDEAYFHTDKENFYFILVRKDKKMFRIKVSKLTSITSVEAFRQVAASITGRL